MATTDTVTIPRDLAEQAHVLLSAFVTTYNTHGDETGSDDYPTDGDVLDALTGELTGEHRDTHQSYDAVTDPRNSFVTHCTCGHTERGMDPDDADAAMADHVENPRKTTDPRYVRGASQHDDDMTDAEWATAYGTNLEN